MVDSPSLEQLRKQAKDLLRAFCAGDPLARKRVTLYLQRFATPSRSGGRDFLLADALHIVARENGFASWPALKAQVTMHPVPLSGSGGPGWRKELVERLAAQAAHLAGRRDVEGLVRCLSAIPRRTFEQLRALMVERGDYPAVVDALVEGLRHRSPAVRFESAAAMDHLADDRCIEPLRQLLHDPVPRVRRMALHALICEDCKIAPLRTRDDLLMLTIKLATADPNINVRRHAVAALGAHCGDARVVRTLQAVLAQESDPAICRNARRALRRHGAGSGRGSPGLRSTGE